MLSLWRVGVQEGKSPSILPTFSANFSLLPIMYPPPPPTLLYVSQWLLDIKRKIFLISKNELMQTSVENVRVDLRK